MAKTNWLKHVTNTYTLLKQSNPEAKLKDAMKMASKTFKKVSSTIDDYTPKRFKTKRSYKGKRKGKKSRKLRRSRKYRGGEEQEKEEEE